MIKDTTIDLLINPYNNKTLTKEAFGSLIDNSGNRIPIINDIPNFLALESTTGLNKKYQDFYDKISKLNDVAEFIYGIFYDLNKLRSDWMSNVEVKSGWKVLETSIGTGWNIKVLPKEAEYYGVDISSGMLRQCQKNRRKWNRSIELIQANAEYLPFKDNIFDSVFHVGGINFFNDRKRAIEEMIRVAKPGTRIVIIDETEDRIAKQYRNTPFVGRFFKESDIDKARTVAPIDLVPKEMTELEVSLLDKGKMYQLSFRLP
jgi:ubiquinone/menaquinone biosynthesis C-methylase UbiE